MSIKNDCKEMVSIKFIKDMGKVKKGEIKKCERNIADRIVESGEGEIIIEKEKTQTKKLTEEQKFKSYCNVCVARRDYYWLYKDGSLFLVKSKEQPTHLGDFAIKKNINGEEAIGLSPFVDNEKVKFGGTDFDVHGWPPKAKELKIQELGQEKADAEELEFKEKQRKQIAKDIPLMTKKLNDLKILHFLNSSGSEGIHLRSYGRDPTNAKVMRYFLMSLQQEVLGEVRHEVFPKQDKLDEETKYGNQMKAVLAPHPKTGNIAGILQKNKVLDKDESLNFLVGFEKKIKKTKNIEFEITEELEQKYTKAKFSETELNQISAEGIPHYCPGFDKVACKQILPSGKVTRHDALDGNAYQYLNDKPDLMNDYKEIQGRDNSAFNNCENWKWSCNTIHKYLRENTGKGIEKWQELCQKCVHFEKGYLPNLKELFKSLDDKDKTYRVVKDIIKKNVDVDPLDKSKIIEEINTLTGIEKKVLKDFFEYEEKQKTESQKKTEKITDETVKEWAAMKKAKYKAEKKKELVCAIETWTDEELKENTINYFTIDNKTGRYLCAKYVLRKYKIMTNILTDEIRAYDDTTKYYQKIGTEKIKNFITEQFDIDSTKQTAEEILHLIRTLTYITEDKIKDARHKGMIPFKNIIYDVIKEKRIEHDPKYFFDYQIPIDYNEDIKDGVFNDFLKEVVNEKDIDLVYDIFALSLYQGNILEKFFTLTGTGSNGKTVLINVLKAFVGNENKSAITLKQMTEDKFSVAATYKKLLNIGAEIGSKIIEDATLLKSACAKDPISGQFKFGQIFDFTPTATLVFCANEPPLFLDTSDGMKRRPEIIHFPNKFGNDEDIKEDATIKKAIPNIEEILITEEQLSGILNKALVNLKNILKNGQLSVVRSITQSDQTYKKYANSAVAFVEGKCEEAPYIPGMKERLDGRDVHSPAEGFILIKDIYPKYVKWCKENLLVAKARNSFTKSIGYMNDWNVETGLLDLDQHNARNKSIRGITWKKTLS